MTKEEFQKLLAYAKTHGKDEKFESIQQQVLKTKTGEFIYEFAKEIEFSDKKALSFAMAQTNDMGFLFEFSKNVEGADQKILSKGIAQTQDWWEIFRFAREVEGADLKVLSQAVADMQIPGVIYEFAKDIQGADIQILSNGMAKTQDAEAMCNFAKKIKGANISSLAQGFLDVKKSSKDFYVPSLFGSARDEQTQAGIKFWSTVISKTGDAKYIYQFAKSVSNADIDILTQAIKNTNNQEYINKFKMDFCNNAQQNANDILSTIKSRQQQSKKDEIILK